MTKHAPNMSHMSTADYKHVYEPNDDTWLFVDALEDEKETLLNARISLEIGSGSGYVSTYLHNMIDTETHKCYFIAVDINEKAAIATKNTLLHNNAGIYHDVVLTAFGDGIAQRLRHQIDVLLFNPPYVPSEDEELDFNDIVASYAGGERGRKVIDEFLPRVQNLLSSTGVFFMVLIQENDPVEVISIMSKEEYGSFHGEVIRKKKVLGEVLYITKFKRK